MDYGAFAGPADRILGGGSSWLMNPDGSVSIAIGQSAVGIAATGLQSVAANPGTAAGTFWSITAPNGGNASVVAVAGGTGGAIAYVAGNGGTSPITGTGTNTGGVGGAVTFTAGNGGTATGGSIANNGGAGGSISLTAGNGGTSGISAGGSIILTPGTATGGGTAGNVQIAQGGLTITAGGLTVTAGTAAFGGLTSGTLGLTITGAAVSLNVSSNFAVNIATGTTNTAVNIGNSAVGVITIANKSNTAATFLITDGTNNYHAIDTRTGTSAVFTHTLSGTAPSFASTASSAYTLLNIPAFTWTVTGGTAMTTTFPGPLSLVIGSPTLTSASSTTAAVTSTVQINGPLPGGSVTFTASYALDIPTFVTNGTGAAGIRIAPPTGAGANYSLHLTGTAIINAASTLLIQTTSAALTIKSNTSGTLTLQGAAAFTVTAGSTMTVSAATSLTLQSAIATPAGGSAAASVLLGTTASFGIYYGSGAPTVSAAAGSLYIRTDNAGANLRLYSNTTGSTTWAAITSA